MHPNYTQPGTIAKEHQDHTLVPYTAVLQATTENWPEIMNVGTPRQSKSNCIILFNALENESYPKLPQKKQVTNKQEKQANNSL